MNFEKLQDLRPKVRRLFSDIGGLEPDSHLSGFQSQMFCEIDPIAVYALKVRFPNIELIDDVRDVSSLHGADVLRAGFPRQDLSSSGDKVGINGSQSLLVNEVFRVFKTNRPKWMITENVRFILRLNKGEAIKRIAESFEQLSYSWAYRVIDSQFFDVPQRRHRVHFVTSREEDPRSVILSNDSGKPESFKEPSIEGLIGFYRIEDAFATGLNRNAIPPLKTGSTIGIPSPPAVCFPDGLVETSDIRDVERIQGFYEDWTEPAKEITKSSIRWRLLGNSIIVNVSE